jgi:hypothetical protein
MNKQLIPPSTRSKMSALSLLIASLVSAQSAQATEGASSNLTLGATTFTTPVFPEPGLYYSAYLNQYNSTRLNDSAGHTLIPDFKLSATVEYNQFAYITPFNFNGVQLAVGAVVPFAWVNENAAGQHQFVRGMGDVLLQPIMLGWRSGNVHAALVQGLYAPTGEYKPADLLSLGRNTWQYQPQLSLGYIDPAGIEATSTVTFNKSRLNKKPMAFFANPFGSAYQSGNELAIDFALGYNVTPHFEAGITGYVYQQTSDDKLADPAANQIFQQYFNGYRGRAFALGPGFRYVTPYGELYGQVQQELVAKNRTLGTSYWLRWNTSLSEIWKQIGGSKP